MKLRQQEKQFGAPDLCAGHALCRANARGNFWPSILLRSRNWPRRTKSNSSPLMKLAQKWQPSIAEFFSEPANRQLIKKLHKVGVHPTAEKREVKSQKLAGKSFVFTGGLANRSREEAGGIGAAARRQSLRLGQQENRLRGSRHRPRLQTRQSQRTRRPHPHRIGIREVAWTKVS